MVKMTRRESRELAFAVLFEQSFTGETVEEIVESAEESRDISFSDFSVQLSSGTESHREEIDRIISENIRGWNISRLSKVSASLLRLAIYELGYEENIPVNVSISEAVELAKIYGGKDDAPYINGVLSTIAKDGSAICEKTVKND